MNIVFDNFNRPNNPTSLGTATTGQVWTPYNFDWTPGDLRWQILSNQAARECGGNPSVGAGGFALVESGTHNCTIRVTINDAAFGGDLNNNNFGIIFRWEDANHYYQAVWSRAGKFLRICKVTAGIFSCTNEGFPGPVQIQDGDTIEVHLCGDLIQGYHNGELTVTADGAGGYFGTQHGIMCSDGVIDATSFALFDDFSIDTNNTCSACCVVPTSHADLQILASQVTPTSFTNLTNVTNVGGSLFRSGGVGGTLDAFADSVNMVEGSGCAYWEYRQFFNDLTTNNLTAIWLTDEFDGPNQYGHIFNNFFGLQRVAWHHGTTTDFSLFYGPTNGDPNQVGRTVGFRFCIYYNNGNVWLDQNAQDTTNTEDFESISGGGQPFIVPNDRRWKVRVYVIPDSVEGAHSPLVTERIANINDICPTGWILPPIGWHATGEVVPALPPQSNSTVRFDSGEGPTPWYLVPQLSDSGNELRAKSLKSVRVTGKVTSAKAKGYGYPILTGISTDDLETGENSETGPVPLPDTEQVTRGERKQIRVPNARLHTVRVEGEWDGTNDPDRVDEVSYEWTEKGVRE